MAELTIKGTLLAVDKEDLFRISITLIIIIFQSALANFGPTACSSAKSPRDIFTERARERDDLRECGAAQLSQCLFRAKRNLSAAAAIGDKLFAEICFPMTNNGVVESAGV
jgi:hypothetical protein